jgi:hypothetical protein
MIHQATIIIILVVHGINSIRPAILRRTTLIEPMARQKV